MWRSRPREVRDVSAQDEVVRALENSIRSGNLPHLLFYGPPGTGKTSTIGAVARELYGPEYIKARKLELNASDERGISVVRDKIKNFAMNTVAGGVDSKGMALPSFKLVVLDEADSLTPDAQSALRRTMETYSRVTRFCLICNYVSRIIDPLTSRCAKFRFKPLDTGSMRRRLAFVADSEGLRLPEETVEALLRVSDGDLRKAITVMQSASQLYGGDVTPEAVVETAGAIPESMATRFWSAVRSTGWPALDAMVKSFACEGFPLASVLDRVLDDLVENSELADLQKAHMAERLARVSRALQEGADESMQLMDLAASMQRILMNQPVSADTMIRE